MATNQNESLSREQSIMRQSTEDTPDHLRNPPKSTKERDDRTVAKRGVFKWMPVLFSNDMVHGSWYYVIGSALTAIIPIFPLMNIYIHQEFWPKSLFLPSNENCTAYALLVFMGVMYTIGSLAFLRAVETPQKPPLFDWKHFASDELFAMWMFALGTLPSIPIMALYVYYNPNNGEFGLALAMCVFGTIVSVAAAMCCYPSLNHVEHPVPTTFLSKVLCTCLCHGSCYHRHLENDWLVVCWGMVIGCAMACVMSAGLTIHEANESNNRGIFDYSTGLADCILFLIGSMYLLAGSYPVPGAKHDIESSSEKATKAPMSSEMIERQQAPTSPPASPHSTKLTAQDSTVSGVNNSAAVNSPTESEQRVSLVELNEMINL